MRSPIFLHSVLDVRRSLPCHPGRRGGVLVMVLVVGVLLPPAVPGTAQSSSPRTDPWTRLAELEKRADTLTTRYRGELVKLNQDKQDAERAARRAHQLSRRLRRLHGRLGRLAAAEYKIGPMESSLRFLLGRDPEKTLSRVTTIEYLARAARQRERQLRPLLVRTAQAKDVARARAIRLEHAIDHLEARRARVQRLIDRYQSQLPTAPGNITPRMAAVFRLVVEKFGAPYGVGCYRPGSSGEHPLGRACDFMLSSGGVLPSSAEVQRGYAIAHWAVANAERLGIMYVIYRQRIWDIRVGGGWRMMEDRGSITANHYDHVHISVF